MFSNNVKINILIHSTMLVLISFAFLGKISSMDAAYAFTIYISLVALHTFLTRRYVEKSNAKGSLQENRAKDLKYQSAEDNSSNAVLIIVDGVIVECNAQAVEYFSSKVKENLMDSPIMKYVPEFQEDGEKSHVKAREMIKMAMKYGAYKFMWKWIQLSGEEVYSELTLHKMKIDGKNALHLIIRDVSEKREAEMELQREKNRLHYVANHDYLTGLPNRLLFKEKLEKSMKDAKIRGKKLALFSIDLDHFKEINDSLGHDVGDMVLKVVTRRLNDVIDNRDVLSRLGGDEFTIIQENSFVESSSRLLARKILEVLQLPIVVEEHTLYLSSSIGVSVYPDDSSSVGDLLKYADSAMYRVKEEGRNGFGYYSSEMTEMAFERIIMEASLRESLQNENFVVHYQPQVNGESNELTGMEALVRWAHPVIGLVHPAEFLPLTISTGMIIELDKFVMRTAMAQATKWHKEGLNPGVMAMNISMNLLREKSFAHMFKSLMDETGCKPEWLELEVTEGQIMSNPEEAIKVLNEINDMGVELAVDDFGTGYSSLAYLKKLPLSKLKIDQIFIRELPYDEEDAGITKAVIALGESLNLKVIAEGVETEAQRDFLVEHGCKNIQGYLYGKPMPVDEMETLIKEGV